MKRIIIICFAALMGFNANAQFALWHYGIIGGPSSTWLINSNASGMGQDLNYTSSMGGTIGLSLTRNFVEKVGIRIDLLYSMHNQKYNGTVGDTSFFSSTYSYNTETKLTYFDIPIMLHLGKSNGFFFEVGPQFGFLLGAKEDFTITPAGSSPSVVESNANYKSDFNSMNIAAVLGFGYNFSVVGLLSIDLGIRLGYGLTDVTKTFPETDWDPPIGMDAVPHSLTSTAANFNSLNTIQSNYSYTKTNRVFGSFLIGATMQIP